MKLITPEISWHQKEPIFSVDFCPQTWKLASCGADFTIKIWQVKEKADGDDSVGIEFLANLDRHAKPVNVVRFSPNGKLLASGGDDGAIVLWKLNENSKNMGGDFDEDFGEDIVNKENWVMHKMLRGHIEDVYDLAWSPDSTQLVTGSVDNSAIIWDANKGQSQKILNDHKHYVQGVCWDPRGHYIATHSSDRSCRVYAAATHKCLHNIHKNKSSYMKDGQMMKPKLTRMFMDETMQSFFRRCTFSPDGSFLFLPAGLCDGENKPRKTSYVFARGHYARPVTHLPGSKKATLAVRCSPICYELMDDKENQPVEFQENNEYFKIPYRMVYAVVSLDAVTFYDTQHRLPIGHCANMHYASLTDATWSSDGRLLVVSSTDGYCSFIKFEEGELGVPISFDPIEYQVTQMNIRAAAKKDAKKKELEAKKKEKETAKKLAASELVEKPEELNKEPTVSTPNTDDQSKEKPTNKTGTTPKPVLDKNQPTIEKLFVTPVRKRKRFPDSPASDANSNMKNSKTDSEADNAPNTGNKLCPSPPNNTPSTPKPNETDKTPKRPQSAPSTKTKDSFSSKNNTTGVKKAPKRANVTTLLTFPKEKDKSSSLSSSSTTDSTPLCGTDNNTPTSKLAKRVTVTTLTTFSETSDVMETSMDKADDEILKSPVEIKSPLPETSVPMTSPVTPKSSLKQKALTPNRSPLHSSTKITYSPKSSKPPKRVQVTTLTTFTDTTGVDTQTTNSTTGTQVATDKDKETQAETSDPSKQKLIILD